MQDESCSHLSKRRLSKKAQVMLFSTQSCAVAASTVLCVENTVRQRVRKEYPQSVPARNPSERGGANHLDPGFGSYDPG